MGYRQMYFTGKDQKTKWKKQKSNIQVRTRSHNIVTYLPGVKPIAKNALSE